MKEYKLKEAIFSLREAFAALKEKFELLIEVLDERFEDEENKRLKDE